MRSENGLLELLIKQIRTVSVESRNGKQIAVIKDEWEVNRDSQGGQHFLIVWVGRTRER